ncbi:hypothetical protein J8I26_04520 [Herbaspirillum sp. LeCh32-8]|uniref:hypothetical protein n=1 Tax=Herbaspirillum sp. LeCh32-8 TaxID=2821356 RepID=UPI001AE81682|nr:hypothetical protein [Herbaspirillum sp. LeCh32-8]MBP0597355.1 hypothetical protein [Herbaspirillum sp. LeCh32-8]
MSPTIGSGGGANVHFSETLVSSTPPPRESDKKEPVKSILKETKPVDPPSEAQVRQERIKAEFLRGALGAAPPNTKQALDALFALGRQQSSRLRPEMRAGASTQVKEEKTPEESAEHEENKAG